MPDKMERYTRTESRAREVCGKVRGEEEGLVGERGRWYRPENMNAQRREGKRAPPDPPILADAKGGRRTKIEGKQREPAWDAGLMDEERTRCRIQSGVNSKQSILTIKRKEKENGKNHNDVRDCVHIGTRRELLLSDDEGDR